MDGGADGDEHRKEPAGASDGENDYEIGDFVREEGNIRLADDPAFLAGKFKPGPIGIVFSLDGIFEITAKEVIAVVSRVMFHEFAILFPREVIAGFDDVPIDIVLLVSTEIAVVKGTVHNDHVPGRFIKVAHIDVFAVGVPDALLSISALLPYLSTKPLRREKCISPYPS